MTTLEKYVWKRLPVPRAIVIQDKDSTREASGIENDETLQMETLDHRELLQSLARPEFPSTPHPVHADIALWLSDKEPRYLITTLFTDVGGYNEEQRKRQRGYSRSTVKTSAQEMRDHLEDIRDKDFSPANYSKRGYALYGFHLQQLGFKMKELNAAVKYRRLDESKLPTAWDARKAFDKEYR
ncbi:hypothetical protein BG011_007096 [Mortierella polycephala]|uniref:Uncharacterized protein n=1 Tax=Mortierella polycephala TaxID=41804 RepID=A0A9P6PTL5_9FUNG|nr:hypothetical protein BG011_007096 [Mortierella polycephala]